MASSMSKTGEVETQQPSPATHDEFYAAVKSAVIAGNLDVVQSLIGQWRSEVSIPGPTPQDINYLVPRETENDGQPAVLDYLLSQGGKISSDTISRSSTQAVFEILMKHGWEINNSVLQTHTSHPNLLSFFLSHGAEPKTPSSRGGYPLDSAALAGPLESVQLLLSHGAPLGPGSRALNAAARGEVPNRIPIMACLLEQGADINGLAEDMMAPSEARRAGRMGTPLHSAAKWDNKEARAWLLEHGADPEAKNELGETPEEWAKRFEKGGQEWMLRMRKRNRERERAKKSEETGTKESAAKAV